MVVHTAEATRINRIIDRFDAKQYCLCAREFRVLLFDSTDAATDDVMSDRVWGDPDGRGKRSIGFKRNKWKDRQT